MTVDEHRGGLTFVFTDIEGSTALVRDLTSSYGLALRIHRRMLLTSFETHGGRQMGSEGDALFFVFPTPSQAVTAAIAAQGKIDHYEWPDGLRLRVRIGVHHGPVRLSGGEYVGLTVHEVSRICGAAHGGQILCSSAIAKTIDPWVAGLRDLGAYELRGISEPHNLFQVEAPGLEADFPPPRDAIRAGGVRVTMWRREAVVAATSGVGDLSFRMAEGVEVEIRTASSGLPGAFLLVVSRHGVVEEEYDGLTIGGLADAATIVNTHSRLIEVIS